MAPSPNPAVPELPLVALLSGFRAEAAIFTTYTLSLAWFEASLHRPLEKAGLRRAVVLADPTGTEESLRERLVAGPGVRYALETVPASGAFHPKVAVLWSSGRLLLAVGSGNLTLPGMQRNLEAWEVFIAGVDDIPAQRRLSHGVARGAAQFFEGLRERLTPGAWAARLCAEGAATLQSWAERLPPDPDVLWIDSLRQTIGSQLVGRLAAPEGKRRLAALSPFYDERGEAVRRLAIDAGCADLDLYFTGDGTGFPLALARTWAAPRVTTHALSGPDQRPLHAKVIEIREPGGIWILSGSANATLRALWTTRNVEACILRRAEAAMLVGDAATPRQHPIHSPDGDPAPLVILSARARARLEVRIGWRSESPPPNRVTLAWLDEDGAVETEWPADGVVELQLPSGSESLRPRPLRLQARAEIAGARFEARAWVSFEDWLEKSREYRQAAAAWTRLLDGLALPDEDDAALLRLFAEEHARVVQALTQGTRPPGPSSGQPAQSEPRPIPLQLLDALARQGIAGDLPHPPGSNRSATVDAVRRAMVSVFRSLDRPTPVPGGGEDGAPPERAHLDGSVRDALDRFEDAVLAECQTLRRTLAGTPADLNTAGILQYTLLCGRLVLRYRSLDGDDRKGLWRSIDRLTRALLCPSNDPPAGPLLPFLAAKAGDEIQEVASLLAGFVALLRWREQSAEPARELVCGLALREALAVLERVTAACDPQLPDGLLQLLAEGKSTLATALTSLRATPPASARMRALLLAVDRVHRGLDDRLAGPSADERAILKDVRQRRFPARVDPWAAVCARCHQQLSPAVRDELIRRAPARCSYFRCQAWLIPLEAV